MSELLIRTLTNKEYHKYKSTCILAVASDPQTCIRKIECIAAQLEQCKKWWLIPCDPSHDESFDAIGPFETAELAWSTLQLLKD